jgi:RNA polymerase sigma factor (sigma-70 family)
MDPFHHRDVGQRGFASTQWSLVLRASQPQDLEALADLCQLYWQPLYGYVRRRVADVHEAQDLTQDFFAWLLEKHTLASASPERGRFRSFLLTAFKNFLANHWDREKAQKRGGQVRKLSLDLAAQESQFLQTPYHDLSPERLYERQWALQLLERVMTDLQQEYDADGRSHQFEILKASLTGERDRLPYAVMAEQLGITEDAARQAALRLRKRYRVLLRQEVARTVADSESVEDEIRNLFEVLGS